MISFLPESWFPKKQNFDFHTPDRWWISPWIIQHRNIQSNGFVEGTNSKLKMIKRTMYGRSGKELLAAKLILSNSQYG